MCHENPNLIFNGSAIYDKSLMTRKYCTLQNIFNCRDPSKWYLHTSINCELFNPKIFLSLTENLTISFLGDSLMTQMGHNLICLLNDHITFHSNSYYNAGYDPCGSQYVTFTNNFTLKEYWLNSGNCFVLPRDHLHSDIIVFNVGAHYGTLQQLQTALVKYWDYFSNFHGMLVAREYSPVGCSPLKSNAPPPTSLQKLETKCF